MFLATLMSLSSAPLLMPPAAQKMSQTKARPFKSGQLHGWTSQSDLSGVQAFLPLSSDPEGTWHMSRCEVADRQTSKGVRQVDVAGAELIGDLGSPHWSCCFLALAKTPSLL